MTMMKILAIVLFLPCILQVSKCSPKEHQVARGMEVAESRGLLTSIRNFFGFGPRRSQSGAQNRERPSHPRQFRRPPPPPNFPGPRPQPLYLYQGHIDVPQREYQQDNLIRVNIQHEDFPEPHEDIYEVQDNNDNIVSVNNVEFDPSEFQPPHPDDIIYHNNEPEHFQPLEPDFRHQHFRDSHLNEEESVNISNEGTVLWPEDREIQNNEIHGNKHVGFSFTKPEDAVDTHISLNSEENDSISDFFGTNDAHTNIVNSHDFKNTDISPKPFFESNSVRNNEDSSSIISGPSDTFHGAFKNHFSSSFGFPSRQPNIFTSSTYSPPEFQIDNFPSTTRGPYIFTSSTYSPPIYFPSTTPSTMPSTTPSTMPSTTQSTTPPTDYPIYSHPSFNLPNTDPAISRKPSFNISPKTIKPNTYKPDFISEVNNNRNMFNFDNVHNINITNYTNQIWHLPTRTPLPKLSYNEGQENAFTISKASLLQSTIQSDTTTPTITTYKPRRVTQNLIKNKITQRARVPARYSRRPTTVSTTSAKTRVPARYSRRPTSFSTPSAKIRASLTTLKPNIPPNETPQRTHAPQKYNPLPKVITQTTPTTTTTTTTTTSTTTTTTAATTTSTTPRPKRSPAPLITSQQESHQPQNYNIAVTNNTKYYSNEAPQIVNFNNDFKKPLDSFLPFSNSEEFFDTIFGAGNPFENKPIYKDTTTQPIYKSGELLYQSINGNVYQGSSQFNRTFTPNTQQQQISFSGLRGPSFLNQGSSEFNRTFTPNTQQQQISFSGLRGPSVLKGITRYTVASDPTESPSQQPQVLQHQTFQPQMREHESPSQQPQVLQHQTFQPQMREHESPSQQPQVPQHQTFQPQMIEHESQRISTAKPRFTQYRYRSTITDQSTTPVTESPTTPFSTNQEHDSQPLAIEGREQIHDDFSSNRVSNYPTKTPTKTESVKQAINTQDMAIVPQLAVDTNVPQELQKTEPQPKTKQKQKPLITSWTSQSLQHSQSGASPHPNVQSQNQRYLVRQRKQPPRPTLTPLQYTKQTTHQSPYTEYQALTHTNPKSTAISKSQTIPQYTSHSVTGTISPPHGVIIDNHVSKKPTFHLGGGYHNWDEASDPTSTTISTFTKAAAISKFSMNNLQTKKFATSFNYPKTTSTATATTRPLLPIENTFSDLYFPDIPNQENTGIIQEGSKDELVSSVDTQKGTTQFAFIEDITIPPRIEGTVEQSDIQEDLGEPLNNDELWGSKSNTNGNATPKSNVGSLGNTFQGTEGEIPVYLVPGRNRPKGNVWTPPTPPSASVTPSVTTRRTYRRRHPGSRHRTAIAAAGAAAPAEDLAAVPREAVVGGDSSSKGRDGLGWGGFPVPLMDLSISSDMQEIMANLDHGGGSGGFPSTMEFMKLPSRGDQKSLSMTSSGEIPIQIDYDNVEVDIPPIPMALKGALELNNDYNNPVQFDDKSVDKKQEDINEAYEDKYGQRSTEEVSDIYEPKCDHGFCEEESFKNADDDK